MKYTGIAFKMAVTIGFGVYAGVYLDDKQGNEVPAWTICLSLLSIAIALWQVIKDVSK